MQTNVQIFEPGSNINQMRGETVAVLDKPNGFSLRVSVLSGKRRPTLLIETFRDEERIGRTYFDVGEPLDALAEAVRRARLADEKVERS